MALDEKTILNIIGTELSQAAGGNENDFLDGNRQAALAAYLGQPDGREVEGGSHVVSTDVADAIEWIMPEIVKAFTQNNEVVTFDANGPHDEVQAELESQFVYDVLMKDNNGFLVIHQFVKDALMQKNGFLKVFYESSDKTTTEDYTGLDDEMIQMIGIMPDMEIIQQTTELKTDDASGQQYNCHDVKVLRTVKKGQVNVVCVPPEEFRVNKQHNSVDLSGCRFSAHVVLRTAGDLVEQGHSKEFVDTIPSSEIYSDDRNYRFYMQDETVYPDDGESLDPSQRLIEVAECYMWIDIDEDGIAELMKIEVAGGDNPDVLLDMETIDENPFISSTAILMSHKLFGLSIYDRLKQIQEQKTSLWRNIFNNLYLQNNQRTKVVKGQVELDDLMINRPGGIVRVNRLDAMEPIVTPALSGDSYKMMDYLDQVRASRSGVSPEGAVTDNMVGDRVGSEGVEKMMNQKEELVGLMVRVIAETGIKPLCTMIRNLVIRHQDVAKDYKFRGNWFKVSPTKWSERPHTTVRVGTGSGNRKEQRSALSFIMDVQERIMARGPTALVDESGVYKAVDDFAKLAGLSSAGTYLIDPESERGKQAKQQLQESQKAAEQKQEQKDMALIEAQVKISKAEEAKVAVSAENNKLKGELEAFKQQSTNETALLKQRLEEAKAIIDKAGKTEELEFKYTELSERTRVEMHRINAQKKMASENQSDGGEE